jgi:predicted phage terminase large subunit-like protein
VTETSIARALSDPEAGIIALDHEDVRGPGGLRRLIALAWPQLEPGTDYSDNWSTDAVCEHLEAVTAGEIRWLVINVPPRTMKSLTVSVMWPTWEWIEAPHTRWIFASYGQHLSTRDNVKARRLMQSPWFQARWGDRFQLTGDQNQKTYYENDALGFRLATSVDGMATGEGSDKQVIDDPHNVRQSESDAVREGTLVWLTETMSTRFNNAKKGARVIVMQRTHARDCSGHMLREGGYDHLCLPMRFERSRLVPHKPDGSPNPMFVPPTTIGFQDPRQEEGELLWKDRFPEKEVKRLEKSLGPYATAGQLQQRPTPRGGGMIKKDRIRVIDEVPPDIQLRLVRSYDFAATDPDKQASSTDPDWTVGALCGVDTFSGYKPPEEDEEDTLMDFDFYVLNVARFRMDPGERDAEVRRIAKLDGPTVTIWIEQEPGASGKAQIFTMRKMLAGHSVNPPRVDPMPASKGVRKTGSVKEAGVPSGNKVQRAEPFATHVYRNRVFMLRGHWNSEYLEEMETFPLGGHDDQVDATSQAFLRLSERPPSIAELMKKQGYYGR